MERSEEGSKRNKEQSISSSLPLTPSPPSDNSLQRVEQTVILDLPSDLGYKDQTLSMTAVQSGQRVEQPRFLDDLVPFDSLEYKDQGLSIQELQHRAIASQNASVTVPIIPRAELYSPCRSSATPLVVVNMGDAIQAVEAQPSEPHGNYNAGNSSSPDRPRNCWFKLTVYASLLFGAAGVAIALYSIVRNDGNGNTSASTSVTNSETESPSDIPTGAGGLRPFPFAPTSHTATQPPTTALAELEELSKTVQPTLSVTSLPSISSTARLTVLCDAQWNAANQCLGESDCAHCLQDAYYDIVKGPGSFSCVSLQSGMCKAIQDDCNTCQPCMTMVTDYFRCIAMAGGCLGLHCPGTIPSTMKAPTSSPMEKSADQITAEPTLVLTTLQPTSQPSTVAPTTRQVLTKEPTKAPTQGPTFRPTRAPTRKPTREPTSKPTLEPTPAPTRQIPFPPPTFTPTPDLDTCTMQLITVDYCIRGTNCADCLNAASLALFEFTDVISCEAFEMGMCEAIYERCWACRGCVAQAEDYYRCIAFTNGDCLNFRCPEAVSLSYKHTVA